MTPTERKRNYAKLQKAIKEAQELMANVEKRSTRMWGHDSMEGIWARLVITDLDEAHENLGRALKWVNKASGRGAKRGGEITYPGKGSSKGNTTLVSRPIRNWSKK